MGVPSFYRWLVKKYPKIVSEAPEEQTGSANPNGVEFDNFYIDMNGIIHACFHPEDDPFPPTTFDDVFGSIYEYIDRLVHIVRPRKLLYMAIDGVAPRAKMNQQRARRFRTSKDIRMAEEIEEKLRKQFEREGKALLPKQESQVTDSNVITPGTEFMHMLSHKLQSYIRLRMSEIPAWGNIKVILSDDNVPGEGEHKIMSFIRAQRASLGYDPNTKHCLYGLDADLIMLALATHEIHFSILREEVLFPKNPLNLASALEHGQHKGKSEILVSCKEAAWNINKKQHYLFLNMWVLREYLALDFRVSFAENEEKYDLERIIDDFIFMCFFSGNDFLPHIPSLQIHEGCMDLLVYVYKKEFEKMGGYLVDMQRVHVHDKKASYIKLKRVERFILLVGEYEDKIFLKRSELRERKLKRILSEHREAKDYEKDELDEGRSSDVLLSSAINDDEEINITASTVDDDAVYVNMKELQVELKNRINNQSDLFKDGVGTDTVKFGKHGWKERYYREKFSAQTPEEAETIRKSVVAKYTEGLCWVLLYYFSGVPSWTWYYPYHYGPLASDCRGLSATKVKFQKGLPFKPFDQLMGVLPPMSAHALPVAYQGLMIDENSNIIDFFPTEFETDMDGKRYMWQGICKLPFIDEERLLRETRKLENEVKDNEKTRNSETLSQLFLGHWQQFELGSRAREASEKIKGAIKIDSPIEDVKGVLHLMLEDLVKSENDYKDNCARNVLHMFYEIRQDLQHIPRLPERVIIPDETVYEEDIEETILWHESRGSNSSSSNRVRPQRPTKLMHNLESRSPISDAAVEFEGSGSGFTLGRGKTSNERAKETFHCHNMQPNLLWDHRASGCQPFVLKSAHDGRSNVGMWKREICERMEGLQISEPNQYPMPYNKPMQVNSNFWLSPRGVTKDGRWHNLRDASGSSMQRNDVERAGLAQLPNQPFSGNRGRQVDCNLWRSPSGVTEDWRRPPSQPFSAYRGRQVDCNLWRSPSGVTEDWRRPPSQPFSAYRGRQVDCNFLPSPRGATGDWRRPPSQPFSAGRGRQVDCNFLPSPRGATGDWRWHKVGDASGGGVQGNFIERAGPAQPSANRGRGGQGRGSGSYVNKNAGTDWNS